MFLTTFIITFVTILSTTSSTNIINKMNDMIQFTIIMTCTMIICGASPYQHVIHTILSSLYVISLLTLDIPTYDDNDDNNNNNSLSKQQQQQGTISSSTTSLDNLLWRISPPMSLSSSTKATTTTSHQIRAHCIMAITIVCQILLLYDRGWQIQRWPVPTIVGSSIGWTLGIIISYLYFIVCSIRRRTEFSSR